MKNLVILSAFFLSSLGCNNGKKPLDYHLAIGQMGWLVGTWQGEYEGKPFFEKWVVTNDTLLQNYALKTEGDTVWAHNGQIRVIEGQVFYTNEPKGDEKLLKWSLADVNERSMRLENPTAPYSRTIVFSHTPDNEWRADLTMDEKTLTHLLKRTQLPDFQIIN